MLRKWLLKGLGVLLAIGATVGASTPAAFAQEGPPAGPPPPLVCRCWCWPLPIERGVIHELTEQTGLTRCEVLGKLAEGQTPAEIAEEAGISPDDIVSGVKEHAAKRLAREVEVGHITQQWADELAQKAAERAERFVESEHSYLAELIYERVCATSGDSG